MSKEIVNCKICLLNSGDTNVFSLDKYDVCNYCNYYASANAKLGNVEDKKKYIDNKVAQMKLAGKGKSYDCILGVSGGTDSSYMAYWAKEQGLRPLVAHFDNGWNSELAAKNIENICKKLGFELQTIVINWPEFKALQLSYLKAGVIDIEALTDHAIYATITRIARDHKIKYTLSGFNYATEAIMPKGWVFDKGDWENIKDIYAKHGSGLSIKTFPHVSFWKKLYYHWFLKLETIQVLNYIPYSKQMAKEIITRELDWKDYGGKHFESVFTKFYQIYILPKKFGVDKRKAHLSNLICSGQLTKEQALQELNLPLYNDNDMAADKEYVLKKLGLSESEFDLYLQEKPRLHTEFKTEKRMWERYFKFVNILKFKFSK
jgi:N-acetyl sugar amidotransferase